MPRSTKGLYKRGGVWWMSYRDALGVQRFESCKTGRKDDAERQLLIRRQEILDGIVPTAKVKPTGLTDFLGEYLQHVTQQRGIETKRLHVRHLIRILGNPPLHTIAVKIIEQYRGKRRGEGVGPATINRELSTLKHALTIAASWKLIRQTHRDELKAVRMDREPPGRLRYLANQDEEDRLLEGCRGRFKALVVVALHTGMRKGELLKLQWDDVDLEQGYIHVRESKSGDRRTIPMNETVWSMLHTLRVRPDIPWVFHTEEGRPYRDTHKTFTWVCKRAKIDNFRFHDLRHSFASKLVMNGVPLATVSHLLGHKSIMMTMRYSHLSPEHRMSAVRSLDRPNTMRETQLDNYLTISGFEATKPPSIPVHEGGSPRVSN
jgi:integrase